MLHVQQLQRQQALNPQGVLCHQILKHAHQKLDKEKGEFDKQLIKLVERFQVFSEIQLWAYMRILPIRNDGNSTWFQPMSNEVMTQEPALFAATMDYFKAVFEAMGPKDYSKADAELLKLK